MTDVAGHCQAARAGAEGVGGSRDSRWARAGAADSLGPLIPRAVQRVLPWLLLLLAARGDASESGATAVPATVPKTASHPGRLAAAAYCSQCHLQPSPEDLDRRTWHEELLPKMRYLVGLEPPPTNGYFRDLPRLVEAGYFPKVPRIPAEQFDRIADYYTNAAPERLASVQDGTRIEVGLPLFRAEAAPFRRSPQRTPFVHIDAPNHAYLAADITTQGIDVLDAAGRAIGSMPLGNIPVSMASNDRHWYFAAIGHFFPREEPVGQVLRVDRRAAKPVPVPILSGQPRLSHVNLGDLNGDGIDDLTVCGFGNFLGRFLWLEGLRDGTFAERVLLNEPGALRCEIRDLDGDGKPDLLLLQAQARETLHLYRNQGGGAFEHRTIFQRRPGWGHSGFDLADFDGDGRPDILITNGDNADFGTSPPKPHHGVRILLNRGGLRWEEAWFGAMNGAYRALARDFDGDGDLDIAAISFFPDFPVTPQEGFLYFENTGGKGRLEFRARTLRQGVTGRWISMDAGDLDGDGDEDLVLGSLIEMPTEVPEKLRSLWKEKGPSTLILRNQTR
jgi:hypothetical protein